jgi:transposase
VARRPKSGRAARQQRSKPVIEALKPWFEDSLAKMSKGSKLAEAFAYDLNHWDGLCRFLEDGRIEIDSNTGALVRFAGRRNRLRSVQ